MVSLDSEPFRAIPELVLFPLADDNPAEDMVLIAAHDRDRARLLMTFVDPSALRIYTDKGFVVGRNVENTAADIVDTAINTMNAARKDSGLNPVIIGRVVGGTSFEITN